MPGILSSLLSTDAFVSTDALVHTGDSILETVDTDPISSSISTITGIIRGRFRRGLSEFQPSPSGFQPSLHHPIHHVTSFTGDDGEDEYLNDIEVQWDGNWTSREGVIQYYNLQHRLKMLMIFIPFFVGGGVAAWALKLPEEQDLDSMMLRGRDKLIMEKATKKGDVRALELIEERDKERIQQDAGENGENQKEIQLKKKGKVEA